MNGHLQATTFGGCPANGDSKHGDFHPQYSGHGAGITLGDVS
jgi:hypothetical protein